MENKKKCPIETRSARSLPGETSPGELRKKYYVLITSTLSKASFRGKLPPKNAAPRFARGADAPSPKGRRCANVATADAGVPANATLTLTRFIYGVLTFDF